VAAGLGLVVTLDVIGRWLVGFGVLAAIVGLLMMAGARLGLGRLPGDISYHRGPVTIFFPIATSIVVSIVLTLLLNLVARWRR
jgi:hypothetical protein